MAEQLSPINGLSNNSINTLVALVNAIVQVLSSDCVTANGSANGGLTIGNAYVSGIFGGSVMVGGQFRGGNVQSSANLVVVSNVSVQNSGALFVGANSVVNSTTVAAPTGQFGNATITKLTQNSISFANATIADSELINVAAGSAVLDSFSLTSGRTAEYVIQSVDNAANNFQSEKVLVTHDGINAYSTRYALLVTNNVVATFGASVNSTSLILTATTSSANATVRAVRTSLSP